MGWLRVFEQLRNVIAKGSITGTKQTRSIFDFNKKKMSTYTVTTKIFPTLNQSILESFKDDINAQHDLTIIYDAIQIACKNIAACIRKARRYRIIKC